MNTMKVETVVPEWVRWITVDKDGMVCGHDSKPIFSDTGGIWYSVGGGMSAILYRGRKPKNCEEELYTWG